MWGTSLFFHYSLTRRDKDTNEVSFENWDVGQQYLGYKVPLLKQKFHLSDYKFL